MKFLKNILKHWKTSTAGIILALLTLMLWMQKITVIEWIEATGALGAIIGLLAKDWDKTDNNS